MMDKDDKLTSKVYDDGLSGATKEIGYLASDIGKAIRYFLSPIQYAASRQKLLEKKLESMVNNIPKDEVVVPRQEVFGKLVQGFAQETSDMLSAIYMELLRKALSKEFCDEIHPAYVNILSQLSSDEALLIYELYKTKHNSGFIGTTHGSAILNYLYLDKNIQKECPLGIPFFHKNSKKFLFPLEKLSQPNLIDVDIGHLTHLGLIRPRTYDGYGAAASIGPDLAIWFPDEMSPHNGPILGNIYPYEITGFGKHFLNVCVSSDDKESLGIKIEYPSTR